MFVSAGVRKLSATTSASMILELSSAYDANNGSFSLYDFSDAKTYVGSKGTTAFVTVGSITHAAPYTSILSLVSSISTDELKIRVNGTQEGSSTAGQGTGNYGNYPLFIGARNAGASLWFNGRLYGLVVAGKQASAAEVTSTETYLNNKTGAF